MNLKDFYRVLKAVSDLLNQYDPTPHYQQLTQLLEQIRSNPRIELQNSITATVNEIGSANAKVENELERIPHADFVIEKLEIKSFVGRGATQALGQLLGEQTFLASAQLNQFTQRFATLRQRVTSIITQLDGFDIDLTDQEEDEERLSFTFLGKSAVESIDEVQKRLNDVNDIIRAFSRLTGDVSDLKSARVISISKSSPLLVDIALIATAANGVKPTIVQIGRAIDWTLDRLERVANIKSQYNRLKHDALLTEVMQQELKKLEKDAASDGPAKEKAEQLFVENKPKSEASGTKAETVKDISVALQKLFKLMCDGANVEVYLPQPEDAEQPDLTVEIVRKNRELRASEELLQLGNTPVVEDDTEMDASQT